MTLLLWFLANVTNRRFFCWQLSKLQVTSRNTVCIINFAYKKVNKMAE